MNGGRSGCRSGCTEPSIVGAVCPIDQCVGFALASASTTPLLPGGATLLVLAPLPSGKYPVSLPEKFGKECGRVSDVPGYMLYIEL